MKILKELASGLVLSLLSLIILMGSFSVSLAESTLSEAGETPTDESILPSTEISLPLPSPSATGEIKPSSTPTPTSTATRLPTATQCPKPSGWESYTVMEGDTLASLAEQRQADVQEIYAGNCLLSQELIVGAELFLPPMPQIIETPTATITVVLCGPPTGWVPYVIKANDTLFLLSINFGVSIYELQLANCMGNSAQIRTGDTLYVPRYPVFLPTYTLTITPLPSETPAVEIPTINPTDTPVDTPIPVETTEVIPVETEEIIIPPEDTTTP